MTSDTPGAPIALLTDFGLRDTYVAMMKAVILGIAPEAPVLDLTHQVAAHNVREGAFDLFVSHAFFPAGTVFCCVIDPGVGSSRRGIALRLRREGGHPYLFVGPDNGLFTAVLDGSAVEAAVSLDDPAYHLSAVSTTFHGRDIFAPAAAHLARGVAIEALGAAVDPDSLVRLPWDRPRKTPDGWEADLIHHDPFGNLISNLPSRELGPDLSGWRVYLNGFEIGPIRRAFSDVPVGRPLAYVGSSGLLEIAVRDGRAADVLSAREGSVVRVRPA
ncbi:MAG: SAM-dependent chlorinase/fluorinase [Deinococcales bacterium]